MSEYQPWRYVAAVDGKVRENDNHTAWRASDRLIDVIRGLRGVVIDLPRLVVVDVAGTIIIYYRVARKR